MLEIGNVEKPDRCPTNKTDDNLEKKHERLCVE
jgi:hypothetical protein